MKTVRPKVLSSDLASLKLTPEEGFVLSRIDGRLSVRDLVALTGLEVTRVEQIVTKLASQGAVAIDAAESSGYLPEAASDPRLEAAAPRAPGGAEGETTSLADFAAVLGMDPSTFAAAERGPAVEAPVSERRVESRSNYPPPAVPSEDEPEAVSEVLPAAEPVDAESDTRLAGADAEDAPSDGTAATEAEGEEAAKDERSYFQLYQSKFHALPTDARIGAAKAAHGPDLLALAFDPETRVVAAILENPTCGLAHVRLIAQHHRTTSGLEMISRRQDFVRDLLVERRLLRNPQCGDTVLGRIMNGKRLLAIYKVCIDRDVPELTRAKSRGHLRKKYQSSASDERAELVTRTEGRCLIFMTGCVFDAKMTQILCGRPYNSVLFIQNLAKFSATPPGLLAHLMKQPFVRKNQALKKLLLQHPNMPGEMKRKF